MSQKNALSKAVRRTFSYFPKMLMLRNAFVNYYLTHCNHLYSFYYIRHNVIHYIDFYLDAHIMWMFADFDGALFAITRTCGVI